MPSGLARSPPDPEEATAVPGRRTLGSRAPELRPPARPSPPAPGVPRPSQRSRAGPGQGPLTQLPRTWQEPEVSRRDNV